MSTWLDSYFFSPSLMQKALAILLLPLSLIYLFFAFLNTKLHFKFIPQIPSISVGNLSFGGNFKTPTTKAIARFLKEHFKDKKIFVILRGYKRKSKGLKLVKLNQKVLLNAYESGDEAQEYAYENFIDAVIVSSDRKKAILKAQNLGADLILLDDAFSKFYIKKFDLLLESAQKPFFDFVLPSGAYRLPKSFEKRADYVALEGRDFFKYSYTKENQKALLITAIAKPFRLFEHFIKARACHFFKDHYFFKKEELENLLKKHNFDTLMLTFKDYVKIKDMGFKTQLISLEIELCEALKEKILNFVKTYKG